MKVGEVITGFALVVLMLSLFNIESILDGSIATFFALLFSGAWLAGYSLYTEEKKREEDL